MTEKNSSKDVVLFLRIEPVEKTNYYSLQLKVKTDAALPAEIKTKPGPVTVTVSGRLTQTLEDFSRYRKKLTRVRIFGATEILSRLIEMEKTIGSEIYHNFFPGNIGETFDGFIKLLLKRKVNRVTLIISSPDPEILDIPFEMLRKDEASEPVLLSYNNFHLVHTIETTLDMFGLSGSEPPAPPLRILYVSALPVDLPEERRLLQLEKEQEMLLEALGPLMMEDKVLVEFLDAATPDDIEKALAAGEHHVVHFSGHGAHLDFQQHKSGVLFMENEEGKTMQVAGKELARRLRKYSSIRLVVLSACETARSVDYGVAGALINGGIPTTLAMRYTVSDDIAACFTERFYTGICPGKSLDHAMFNARTAVYDHEKKKIADLEKDDSGPMVYLEWTTPYLYQNQHTLQWVDYSKEKTDTQYFFPKQVNLVHGGKYVGRGFIGRRREIIKLHRLFGEGERCVCIYGQGGLGKTTLAIRFADNYQNGAYKIIQFRGDISEETILTRLTAAASRYMGNKFAQEMQSPDFDAMDKLSILIEQFLSRHKIIILFDEFEQNQRASKKSGSGRWEIGSPRLKAFLNHLCSKLDRSSYILFTTRYLFDEPRTTPLNLGEMQVSDAYKLFARNTNLVRLPADQKRLVYDTLGGHPHALGLLEKYSGMEGVRFEDISINILAVKSKEHNRDRVLDMLWDQLTGDERTALSGASVFADLAPPEGLTAVTGLPAKTIRRAIKSLNSLSLVYIEEDRFLTHRLTASFVQKTKIGSRQLLAYHHNAAEYFAGQRDETGKKDIGNAIEARSHFLLAEEWDRAAEITFETDILLKHLGYHRVSFEHLKEIEDIELTAKNRSTLFHHLGMLHLDFGEYDKALIHYQKSVDISMKTGDMKSVADSLGEMGIIWKNVGDYHKALTYYQQSMEIAEKINDKKSIAVALHNIGNVFDYMGHYDEALAHLQKSMKISEETGEIIEVSNSLHQMGVVYQHKGLYDAAMSCYQKALEISAEFNDVKGAASTLHQIGNIYCIKRAYDTALEYYEQSLEIKQEIGDLRGLADTLHQIGMVYQKLGDYDKALMHAQKAMDLSVKVGDTKGAADSSQLVAKIHQYNGDFETALMLYQQGLETYKKLRDPVGGGTTLGQMGKLYAGLNDFPTALECSLEAFKIFTEIGSPKASQAVMDILLSRMALPDSEFKKIVKAHGIAPDTFDGYQ